jgi:hypothetical protein
MMPEELMTWFCRPAMTCFPELESRDLKVLVLIPFCRAREELSRFAGGSSKTRED